MQRQDRRDKFDIERKHTGVYSFDGKNLPAYVLSWMPSDKEVERKYTSSYVFLQNPPSTYYIDESGKQMKLPISPKKVEKLVNPPKEMLTKKEGVDVYSLKKMPENPVEYARKKLSGDSDKVYIFAEKQLLLVDRVSGRSLNVELDDKQLERVEDYFKQKHTNPLKGEEHSIFPDHKENVEKLNDESRALAGSVDEKQFNKFWKKISACPTHENGEYTIYRSVLDPHGYMPNEGDAISPPFLRRLEIHVQPTKN